MDQIDEYRQQRMANLLGLRAFPRSIGMIAGAITLLITKNPYTAIEVCLGVWFVTFLIKTALALHVVDTIIWSYCSLPVNACSVWFIRWIIYIILVVIALFRGAPITQTLFIMGGILLYDFIIVRIRGS